MCDFFWGGYRRHSRGAAARPRLEARPCPPDPPVPSTPVGPGVLLCWRAPSLPRVRYKILPARLLGGENGIKLSLHVEKAPNWVISGEQGEFCTGNAARAGVQGEFCPAHTVRGGVLGEFCPGSEAVRLVQGEFYTEAARRGSCWARFVSPWHLMVCAVAGLSPPTGAPAWPSRPCSALDTGSGGGFAALEAGWRRISGVSRL